MTLDEIARSVNTPITRERVRQKERKLLKELAGALIWDDYDGLGVLFRPSFSIWWKLAAKHFGKHENTSFDEFVGGLSEVWGADVPLLTEQLPIILAIVTGENKMPDAFKSAIRLDPVLYGDLIPETRNLCLTRLRLGTFAFKLQKVGVDTIGDLVDVCRSGMISNIESRATELGIQQLTLIAECLERDGQISWAEYRRKTGLNTLPAVAPSSPAGFANDLPETIASLLKLAQVTGRAKDIYELRTGRIRTERLTLAEVADQLGSHGSSIKREETVFLQYLNDLIFEREFCKSPVWLEESWLSYWREASEEFATAGGDFERFRRRLSTRWSVNVNRLILASPTLWSVIGGYPNGRPIRARTTILKNCDKDPHEVGMIKLRGFRQVH